MSDDEKYRLTYVAVTRARHNIKVFISKKSATSIPQRVPAEQIIDTKNQFEKMDDMLKKIGI